MPGMGELIDGAMQQAPQPGRQSMGAGVVMLVIDKNDHQENSIVGNYMLSVRGRQQERTNMAKSMAFGVVHVIIAFGVGYALTGSVAVAGALTLIEPLINSVAHFFFDRWWGHPAWRRWAVSLKGMVAQTAGRS